MQRAWDQQTQNDHVSLRGKLCENGWVCVHVERIHIYGKKDYVYDLITKHNEKYNLVSLETPEFVAPSAVCSFILCFHFQKSSCEYVI